MNRRSAIQDIIGLGSAAVFSAQAQDSPKELPLQLGVATYSLRNFRRDYVIRAIKTLGVGYVDVKEFHLPYNDTSSELAAGRKQFDAAGISVVGGGNITLNGNDEGSLKRYFDYARNCGFKMMICAPTHENLKLVEHLAKQYDVRIAIHNHGPEDKHFPTPSSVLDAVAKMDARMGLCLDIGHTARTGESIVDSIRAAQSRLFEVHMKDLRDTSAKESQCIVGEGVLPIPAIFQALRGIRYQGTCSLEYEIDEFDPLPGMSRSFAYMRGVIAGQQS